MGRQLVRSRTRCTAVAELLVLLRSIAQLCCSSSLHARGLCAVTACTALPLHCWGLAHDWWLGKFELLWGAVTAALWDLLVLATVRLGRRRLCAIYALWLTLDLRNIKHPCVQ